MIRMIQEIARRRRRVALITNVVDGRDLSQESENSPSGPDEADSIHSMSSISASSTGPNSGLSDGPVLDKAYVSGSRPSIPAKLPENPTSSFSAISGQWEGKPVGVVLPPESVEFNLNSSEVENESRLSAKLDGDHAYSEKDQAILSSDNKSSVHLDSAVKAEEMNTVTDSLSMAFETYTPKTDMEQPMFENLLDSMNEFTPEDKKPVAGDNVMNVILVAAECSPFSKTGGLGDVAGSLPKALARRGHRVI